MLGARGASQNTPGAWVYSASTAREAKLERMFAAGWTTELFEALWKPPALKYIPAILGDAVRVYLPGGLGGRGREEYVRAVEELLALVPELWLDVKEQAMSADGEFGFARWVMHATGANGPFELDGVDRARVRNRLVCENYVFFDTAQLRRSA